MMPPLDQLLKELEAQFRRIAALSSSEVTNIPRMYKTQRGQTVREVVEHESLAAASLIKEFRAGGGYA